MDFRKGFSLLVIILQAAMCSCVYSTWQTACSPVCTASALVAILCGWSVPNYVPRKIVDHVNLLTSPDQVAEYVCAFRDAFWPNGTLAEKRLPRDEQTKMRTRVLCKAKMLGSVSDEMCTLMGMESVRRGVDNVFNMFQHKQLNKRFLYVFLESAFVALVPDNKLDNLFRKQHSGSQRVKGVGRKTDGAGPVQNSVRRRQANR